MSADEIDYSLQWNSNDSQLNILGNFKNANRGYTRLVGEEDEDGITHLKILFITGGKQASEPVCCRLFQGECS